MDKLTDTQKNFRKQMGKLDEEYKNNHKNNNSKNIIITIIIFAIIIAFGIIKFNFGSKNNSNYFIKNYSDKEYVFNYLKEYNFDEIIFTHNNIINRFIKNENYDSIKDDIKIELKYINSMYVKLKNFYPKEQIYNLHTLNLSQLEQLKYLYELIINSNEITVVIDDASKNYIKKHKIYFDEMIKIIDSSGFDYTIHNDGSVTYSYTDIKY